MLSSARTCLSSIRDSVPTAADLRLRGRTLFANVPIPVKVAVISAAGAVASFSVVANSGVIGAIGITSVLLAMSPKDAKYNKLANQVVNVITTGSNIIAGMIYVEKFSLDYILKVATGAFMLAALTGGVGVIRDRVDIKSVSGVVAISVISLVINGSVIIVYKNSNAMPGEQSDRDNMIRASQGGVATAVCIGATVLGALIGVKCGANTDNINSPHTAQVTITGRSSNSLPDPRTARRARYVVGSEQAAVVAAEQSIMPMGTDNNPHAFLSNSSGVLFHHTS